MYDSEKSRLTNTRLNQALHEFNMKMKDWVNVNGTKFQPSEFTIKILENTIKHCFKVRQFLSDSPAFLSLFSFIYHSINTVKKSYLSARKTIMQLLNCIVEAYIAKFIFYYNIMVFFKTNSL